MFSINALRPKERLLSIELRKTNPDIPGLFVFQDGGWIADHSGPKGIGTGSSPDEAVANLRRAINGEEPVWI